MVSGIFSNGSRRFRRVLLPANVLSECKSTSTPGAGVLQSVPRTGENTVNTLSSNSYILSGIIRIARLGGHKGV